MNIDQIIGKMMGDDSLGDEKSALESWKKEAEENIKALEDIRKISALSEELKGYEDFDSESGWESFEQNLEDETKVVELVNETTTEVKTSAKQFSIGRWSSVAAVAVLLIGSLFLFNNYNSSPSGFESVDYASNEVKLNQELLDGTNVILDLNTKLRTKDERTVSLKGRAFFDVARDETNQFKINLPVGEITVLGTEFTVVADDKHTEVYVEEGKVAFKFQGTTYALVAGEFIQVVNNNVEKLSMKDQNYASWKNNRLLFNDNTMPEVVEALSRHFGKVVELNNPKQFKNCNVKTTFDNPILEDILNEFSTTHGMKYEVHDGKYVVSSSEC